MVRQEFGGRTCSRSNDDHEALLRRHARQQVTERAVPGNTDDVLAPDPQITCIDCGGRAFLLTPPREDGAWYPGDVVAYRCEDCLDRWDLVLDDDAVDDD